VSEIKVGDVVWVKYPTNCCGLHGRMGQIFVVKAIETGVTRCQCGVSKTRTYADSGLKSWAPNSTTFCPELSRLEKFPDLTADERDGMSTELEVQS
jgi:hypothetical protein